MKRTTRSGRKAPMSPDAYAGFLKLWISPTHTIPQMSPDVDAYLRYANQREPLSPTTRFALGLPTRSAA